MGKRYRDKTPEGKKAKRPRKDEEQAGGRSGEEGKEEHTEEGISTKKAEPTPPNKRKLVQKQINMIFSVLKTTKRTEVETKDEVARQDGVEEKKEGRQAG